MPTWAKVVLIVVLAGFMVAAVGIFFAARWIRSRGASLQQEGKAVAVQGEEFGRGKNAQACIDESLTRLRSAPGFIGEAKVKLFLQSCLRTATVDEETCRDVPATMSLIDTARWQMRECAKHGWANDQRCMRTISALQLTCEQRKQ